MSLQISKSEVLSLNDIDADIPAEFKKAGTIIGGSFAPGLEVYGVPIGTDTFVENWLQTKLDTLKSSKNRTCKLLNSDKQALWSLLSLASMRN